MRNTPALWASSLAVFAAGCPGMQPGGAVSLTFDFADGAQGWEANFTDYTAGEEVTIDFESGIRALPEELQTEASGFFVSFSNSSDDIFVFLKRRIGAAQGLAPNQAYRLTYRLTIASNAPSDCFGAGGAPGEGLYVKVGGAADEPEPLEPDESGYIALSVDKGVQSSGGPAATVIGNLANGEPCDDPTNAPYVTIERSGEHETAVTTDDQGDLWLLVGTDSAFEGISAFYYQSIEVELTPQ